MDRPWINQGCHLLNNRQGFYYNYGSGWGDTGPGAFAVVEQMEGTVEYRIGIDLRVILAERGDFWLAQAVDIDYAVAGQSKEDAKKRFEIGLGQTIHEHLTTWRSLERLLATKPPIEDWMPLLFIKGERLRLTGETKHLVREGIISEDKAASLPYEQIQYLEPVAAAA